jgi:hypothetical protein
MIMWGDGYYFPEKRFRFLIEWDPIALTQTDGYLYLPIYYATIFFTMKAFRRVFEYGIRYYPKKKGFSLLFKKGREDRTPFQAACKAFVYKDVMEVINETLARNSDIPVNVADALITAAIDENIHLDCVYFLLRRQPDVLQKSLLSSTTITSAADINSIDIENNDGNNDKNDNSIKPKTTSPKKRKRIIEKMNDHDDDA